MLSILSWLKTKNKALFKINFLLKLIFDKKWSRVIRGFNGRLLKNPIKKFKQLITNLLARSWQTPA